MIQPRSALPLLAVAGLGVRDIFGTAITCLVTGATMPCLGAG